MDRDIELYRNNLFLDRHEMLQSLTDRQADRVIRIRDLYLYVLSNPTEPDRRVIDYYTRVYSLQSRQAYEDLHIVRRLLPMITQATKDFHRFRYNEMIMEVYNKAKEDGDLKTMERAASSYAKFNKVEEEEQSEIPYDQIVVQPFTATSDPSVLGIKPLPNLRERIDKLLKKYSADNPDVEDIEFEESDV